MVSKTLYAIVAVIIAIALSVIFLNPSVTNAQSTVIKHGKTFEEILTQGTTCAESIRNPLPPLGATDFLQMLQEMAAQYPPTEENMRADLLLMQQRIIPMYNKPVPYVPGKTYGDLFWLEDECKEECVFDWIIADFNAKYGLHLSKQKWMRELTDKYIDDIMRAKYHFNKPRPIVMRDKLHIPIQAFDVASAKSPALPSGHAIQAMMFGCIVYRDCKDVLTPDDVQRMALVCFDVGLRRVVGGVHYPSDVLGAILFVRYATQDLHVDPMVDLYEKYANDVFSRL